MDVTVTIDGKQAQVPAGSTVLDAIRRLDIHLPQLCKDPDRPPLGACRTCLVQIEGVRGTPASCSTPARDGMVVHTDSEEVVRIRRGVLELTLGMLTADGNGKTGFGELTEAARRHGLETSSYQPHHHFETDDSKSFFVLDRNSCIMCGRCTDGCDQVQHIGAISLMGKGHDSKVGVFGDGLMSSSICTSCGQCVATCPTQALRVKEKQLPIVKQVDTTCPYCGVGCGINLKVRDDGRISVMADDAPKNLSSLGMLCVKGRFGTGYIHHNERITTPLIKRDGQWQEASWDEALDLVATKFAERRGRFGALASAKGTNEEGYVIQKFVRAVMGTNNIDHCTRLCHSPSVEAMLAQLGSGATSNSYIDYEEAGCLMVIGSDTTSNHPVVAARLRKAVVKNGAKLIVVNPRRIDLCDYADIWIRQLPGTDVALFNGLAHIILKEGLWNPEFVEKRTEGFDEWRKVVESYRPERVSQITGVPVADLERAARIYAKPPHGGSCLIWGMGVTQHINGTANANSILNLALLTGQLGKPASGVSPLRGQNNVQGCGDAGCIPNAFPGYQSADSLSVQMKFAQAWGAPMPERSGLVVTEMVQAIDNGDMTAMYIVGENPLLSEPDLNHAKEAIDKLEFLVVQDLFMNETAEIADVFLPAASFAEKDGTFTNSERRVQPVRAAIPPVGQSRPDWEITREIARRTLQKLGREPKGFDFAGPSEIFDEMASLWPSIAGINYQRLERDGGIQYPCPTPDHPGTRFLYEKDFPRGNGRFILVEQGPQAAELPDKRFSLILNTGRILYHWHGGTITTHVDGLVQLAPELEVSMNPADAARFEISDGERVRVRSRRGELTAVARLTEKMRQGEVFVPFVKLQGSAANFLTNSAFDPDSKIPEFKVCAVRVEKLSDVSGREKMLARSRRSSEEPAPVHGP